MACRRWPNSSLPSPDGEFVAYFEHERGERWLGVARMDGSEARRVAEVRPLHDPVPPVWSPDGSTIFAEHGPEAEAGSQGLPIEILAVDVDTGATRVVVDSTTGGSSPAVSADGSTLAFDSGRDSNGDIFIVPVEGGEPTKLTSEPEAQVSPTWLPDSRIVYWGQIDGNGDVFVMDADGAAVMNLSDHPATDFVYSIGGFSPPVSPNGGWVAFQSDRSGTAELYIARTNGREIRQLSTGAYGSAGIPAWSPDSSYLAYSATMRGEQGIFITRIRTARRHISRRDCGLPGCRNTGSATPPPSLSRA